MSDEPKITINPVIVTLVVLQIVFIILMIFSFNNVLKVDNPVLNVGVNGLDQEIEGLTEEGKQDIEYSIYRAIANNSANSDTVQRSGVYVRDGSLVNTYFEKINIKYISFIADIPDLEQSYKVAYVWTDDSSNKYVSPDYTAVTFCLPKEQLGYAKKEIVANLIRGNDYMIPGYDDVGILFDSNVQFDNFRIRFNYLICESQCSCVTVSEEKKEEAIKAFEDYYIYGLGFVPSELSYYFDNCN